MLKFLSKFPLRLIVVISFMVVALPSQKALEKNPKAKPILNSMKNDDGSEISAFEILKLNDWKPCTFTQNFKENYFSKLIL